MVDTVKWLRIVGERRLKKRVEGERKVRQIVGERKNENRGREKSWKIRERFINRGREKG